MVVLIIANSWVGIPFNMLLLTTGLNNIPGDVYEAASIDGATSVQKFFKITIPLFKTNNYVSTDSGIRTYLQSI